MNQTTTLLYLLMSVCTSRAAVRTKRVVETTAQAVLMKLIHVKELRMICGLQALLFTLETNSM